MSPAHALALEAARFRSWDAAYAPPGVARGGEWECAYRGWSEIHAAVDAHLAGQPTLAPGSAELHDLLYLLARDNEHERIAALVRQHLPGAAVVALAEASIVAGEPEARWQLASLLGSPGLAPLDAVEPVLVRLARDPDEYVRRMALRALTEVGSSRAEALALAAWDDPGEAQEWTRMNVLWVLERTRSSHLAARRAEAEADPRPYLSEFARNLGR